ncbi:MAG: MoxR family ATPase [Paludibacteraceae bacterium]|nr:MoxR family ATPase [Paludibacteraceae bacterium]
MENSEVFTQNLYVDKIQSMRQTISQYILGQERMADLILTAVLADGHVLIEGVPGVAKTLTSRLIARLVDADFSRIQFTSDIMPSDVLGTNIFNQSNSQFEFHKGPAFGNIVLVDEINRAPAKTQSALFEVMEERQVTVDGIRYPMGSIYTILATQNPIEQEGTYRLPEAQMDRFLFKISVGYPSFTDEVNIMKEHNTNRNFTKLEEVKPILTRSELEELRQKAQSVFIDDKMLNYIVSMVQATRTNSAIYIGASPRASIALLNASKAYALLQGRDFVIPDDIKMLAKPVLCHRITLTAEAELEGNTIDNVINNIVGKVEVPK